MSQAWEVTQDDVELVLDRAGVSTTPKLVEEAHDHIDGDLVEQAALRGDEMETQVSLASVEIHRQLKQEGYIK